MKKLSKELFGFDYKKIFTFLFSLFLGAILVFGNNIVYNGDIYAKGKDIVINSISFWEVILFLVISIGIYILINIINLEVYQGNMFFLKKTRKMSWKRFLLLFSSFLLVWSPYLLTYYPGAVYSDAFTSMNQALFFKIDNHHTLLYSYFISIFAHLGKSLNDYNIAIFLYTIIQYIFMAFVLASVVKWLYNRGLKKGYLVFILIVYLFCPLFPYYAIATWKDTYFSLFLLLYIIYFIDYLTGKIDFKKKRNIFKFLVLSFFVCFLRNNGIYVIAFTLACLIVFDFKKISKNKVFLIVDGIFVILTFIIQGPVYRNLKLGTEFVENIAIPMQQVGAIITNGEYSKSDVKTISKIWNLSEVKEKYTPYLADTMKWYLDSFDEDYLDNHKSEFISEWLLLVKKNPDIAFTSYLLETLGYWHVKYASNICYIQDGVWENFYKVKQHDYFEKIFNFSFANIVRPARYISSGLFFFVILLFGIISFRKKGFKGFVAFAPLIAIWLTIMIATPIAFSLRYVYIFVLFIPLSFLLPEILEDY